MADPIPISREHKKLGDELDDIYIETVNASIFARGYLIHKKGNPNELFLQFYYPFGALFQHTRYMREMSNVDKELIIEIENWINLQDKPRPSTMLKGLNLFSKYQEPLLKNGVIILKRE